MHRSLKKFCSSRSGAALMEFAFVAPMLLLLLFGAIEVSRYIMITQRVEKAGYTLGDILTQYTPPLTQTNVDDVLAQFNTVMSPYGSSIREQVIFTSVTKDPADNNIYVDWQRHGGGVLDNPQTVSIVDERGIDDIGPNNPPPHTVQANFSNDQEILNLLQPGQLTGMAPGENMIVAEVYYQYQPILTRILSSVGLNIGQTTLTRRMFMRPRIADLNVPPA